MHFNILNFTVSDNKYKLDVWYSHLKLLLTADATRETGAKGTI